MVSFVSGTCRGAPDDRVIDIIPDGSGRPRMRLGPFMLFLGGIRTRFSAARRSLLSGAAPAMSAMSSAPAAPFARRSGVVDALLAPPRIPLKDLGMDTAERAAKRHVFQRGVFEASFPAGTRRPTIVAVAGTKGKGSVSELLRAALTADSAAFGAVGCFTSPHLHGCRERVRVGADPIAADVLDVLGAAALRRAEDEGADAWGAVFFDRLLATALLHFGAEGCGVLVLECGIGGLYDSTNFYGDDDLALAVITPISLDHTLMLGTTLADIARHKAGVMRRGVVCVTPSSQPAEVLATLQAEAARVGALLEVVDVADGGGDGASTHRENLRLVEAACLSLGVEFRGVGDAKWPGRFELLEPAGRKPVLVDAAHNGHSVRRLLADAAAAYPAVRNWSLVFGCGDEKEGRDDMLAALSSFPFVTALFVEAAYGGRPLPPSKRPAPASALAAKLEGTRLRAAAAAATPPSTAAALDAAASDPSADAAVLVCGSVYVAAEAREWAADVDAGCLPADDWAKTLRD